MKKLLFLLLVATVFTSCDLFNSHGKKITINESEVFYKDGATESEAKKLGKYLLKAGWFDEETKASAQLIKDDETYVVKLVVDKDKLTDKMKLTMWKFQYDLSQEIFNGEKVKLAFVDTKMKNDEELGSIARLKVEETNSIYYNNEDFKKSQVKKLGDFFVQQQYFSKGNEIDVFLTKEKGAPVIRMIVDKKKVTEAEDQYLPIFSYLQDQMNTTVFTTKKAKLKLTSSSYEDFKNVPKLTAKQKEEIFARNTENEVEQPSSSESTISGVERYQD